ncbi:MAG: hypothetical protein KKF68_02975 [Nanoarchaeota archaeon]|nr:hypothetical protein [Nanoarchaeota archaeon]
MAPEEDIALFDMDGTLCDHDSALSRDLKKISNQNNYQHIPFNRNAPEYIQRRIDLIRNQPGWWENLKPLKIGFDILNIAKELEFRISILSKGPSSSENAWTEKVRWAKKYVPDAEITLTQDKGLVYGKVLVDDYPGYITSWLKYRPRGIVIMPIHEYNKEFKGENILPCDGSNLAEVKKILQWAKNRTTPPKL